MNRDTRYPIITASLFLWPQYDTTSRAGRDLAIGFLRAVKAASPRNRCSAVVPRHKSRRQRFQHRGRGREVALQRVHTKEAAFVVIEIGEVEANFAPAGRRDFDQPTA